jgi:hypothetical protein
VRELSNVHYCAALFIPSSIQVVHPSGFCPASRQFVTIAFERGSELREMNLDSFRLARCLCVPASVESFSPGYAARWDSLLFLAFESGSRVRRIEEPLFLGANLFFVFLPPSLEYIGGFTFSSPRVFHGQAPVRMSVVLGRENRHFAVVDNSFMNFTRTSLIRYIGRESNITVDSMVETLCSYCFSDVKMSNVTFAATSRLREIGRCAFWFCRLLIAITIPSTVQFIRTKAFGECTSLQNVFFRTASELQIIEDLAFEHCYTLQPVDVPSHAKVCGDVKVLCKIPGSDDSKYRRIQFRYRIPHTRRGLFRRRRTSSEEAAFDDGRFLRNLAF